VQQTLKESVSTSLSTPFTGHGYGYGARSRFEVRDARVRPAAGADESPALRAFQDAHPISRWPGLEPNNGLRASVQDWKHVALWWWSSQCLSKWFTYLASSTVWDHDNQVCLKT